MHRAGGVFVSLGEEIRFDDSEIDDRRGVAIHHDVIDHFERGQIHCAQILRHIGPHVSFLDVLIRRQAGDQDVGLGLGVEEMAHMAGVHHVEGAVAHDDFFLARARADRIGDLSRGLDLVRIEVFACRIHHQFPCGVMNSNQVLVAVAIESGSQSGALRQ